MLGWLDIPSGKTHTHTLVKTYALHALDDSDSSMRQHHDLYYVSMISMLFLCCVMLSLGSLSLELKQKGLEVSTDSLHSDRCNSQQEEQQLHWWKCRREWFEWVGTSIDPEPLHQLTMCNQAGSIILTVQMSANGQNWMAVTPHTPGNVHGESFAPQRVFIRFDHSGQGGTTTPSPGPGFPRLKDIICPKLQGLWLTQPKGFCLPWEWPQTLGFQQLEDMTG